VVGAVITCKLQRFVLNCRSPDIGRKGIEENDQLQHCLKMVNEACSYPKTGLDGMYQIDADLEMEKLLLLIMQQIKIDSSEYPLRTRAPAAMQSNTDIPPPARFTRKKRSFATTKHGHAQPSTTLASPDKPASAHHRECAINAPFSEEFDRIFEGLLLDTDYPDALSSTQPLNS
jgi:hypothetical protein